MELHLALCGHSEAEVDDDHSSTSDELEGLQGEALDPVYASNEFIAMG